MEKINFKKVRDFGEIFNDSFLFLKKNFKSLFKCILFIPGPIILIAGILSGYFQAVVGNPSQLFNPMQMGSTWSIMAQVLYVALPYVLLSCLASMVLFSTIYNYIIAYNNKPAGEVITVSEIGKTIPGSVWRLFYNNLLLLLISLILIIAVGLFAMIPFLGAIGLFFGMIILFPPLMYTITAANYLVLRDKVLITDGIAKAWKYMRGKFWWTWLLVVCVGMIVWVASLIFTLPLSILSIGKMITRMNPADMSTEGNSINTLPYIVFGAIAYLGQQLVQPIIHIFCAFNFSSHEEAHEGTGLLERMDEIGNDTASNPE